jgi:hypothetical protein
MIRSRLISYLSHVNLADHVLMWFDIFDIPCDPDALPLTPTLWLQDVRLMFLLAGISHKVTMTGITIKLKVLLSEIHGVCHSES